METSRLILIGAAASAIITTIAVLILDTGSDETQTGVQKEQAGEMGAQGLNQNGGSDGKGGSSDWDLG
jgi:uncharacterized membrane protein YgcG